MPGHSTGTFPTEAPSSPIIDSADIPQGDGSTGDVPEFVYPDDYYGFKIDQPVFRWLRDNLPRERTDGKPLLGVGVCIWRPEDRDWRKPWMSFAFNASFNWLDPVQFTGNNAEHLLYIENAKRKAKFTMRTGLPSAAAFETHRHLREPGDFCYDGCVIIGDVLSQGVIVSISGYTKEQDAQAAKQAGEYLTAEMRSVIDEHDEITSSAPEQYSHYWQAGPHKDGALELIRRGLPVID